MYWLAVEKQRMKISIEKYRARPHASASKIHFTLCLKMFLILTSPGIFLIEFHITEMYSEGKWRRQRIGLTYKPGAELVFTFVHSYCSNWRHLLFYYPFVILNSDYANTFSFHFPGNDKWNSGQNIKVCYVYN